MSDFLILFTGHGAGCFSERGICPDERPAPRPFVRRFRTLAKVALFDLALEGKDA
jgi:hypothetical protein